MPDFAEILKSMRKRPEPKLVLRLDALYYRSAQNQYRGLTRPERKISIAQERVDELLEQERIVLDEHGGDSDKAYDELEPIAIQMEGADYQLSEAYEPLVRGIALIHILCAASLECHINSRARASLRGKVVDEFDRLSITAKWLFLPKILGVGELDPGREPFQSFDRLIKTRNALLHYREKSEPWIGSTLPSFLSDIGISKTESKKSLESTKKMIETMAKFLSEDPPNWLKYNIASQFEVVFG